MPEAFNGLLVERVHLCHLPMQAIGVFLDAINPGALQSSMADLDTSLNTNLVAAVAALQSALSAFGQYGPPGTGDIGSMEQWLLDLQAAPATLTDMSNKAAALETACTSVAAGGAK